MFYTGSYYQLKYSLMLTFPSITFKFLLKSIAKFFRFLENIVTFLGTSLVAIYVGIVLVFTSGDVRYKIVVNQSKEAKRAR